MYVAMDRATSTRLFVSMRVEFVVHGVLCVFGTPLSVFVPVRLGIRTSLDLKGKGRSTFT